MYANDTHVTLKSMNVEELVHETQEELTHISEYMSLNQLSANPQKTEYIGHPRRTKVEKHEILRLTGSDIKQLKKTKLREVFVDEGLN